MGIWTNLSYQVAMNVQAVFVLGRFSAAELVTTGVEPVTITAQGWRNIGHGPFTAEGGSFTDLKDLLNQEDITLDIIDRQTNLHVATIKGCKPTGLSSAVTSKTLQEQTNTYLGLLYSDESGDQEEPAGSSDLPPHI